MSLQLEKMESLTYMKKISGKHLFLPLVVILVFFGCFTRSEGVKDGSIKLIINTILSKHVSEKKFDDKVSERTFDNIFKLIDQNKVYFLASDIDEFSKYRTKLDDLTKDNDYDVLIAIYKRYLERFEERMKLVNSLIDENVDFTIDEKLIIDPDLLSYVVNETEVKERWRKRIKFQLLNYLNTDMDLAEARKKLKKRYELLAKDVENYEDIDVVSIYLNAFSLALDPHTAYMTPKSYEDFKIQMNLKLTGIGAVLRSEDGFVIVDSIIPGGPVSKMDPEKTVKVNDKIIAVGQGDDEAEIVVDVILRDAVAKIRGKKGTTVKLTVLRKDPQTKEEQRLVIPIVRDNVILEQSAAKYALHTVENDGKKVNIGYIKFPSFYLDYDAVRKGDPKAKVGSTDVFNAIAYFNTKKADVLVFDLRDNPGGALTEARNIAGFFIEKGPILQVKDQNNVYVYEDKDQAMYYTGPLVVLVNGNSASASEIFAGAIRDYRRGLLIGPTKTFGKGSVQDLQELGNKSGAIKVTIQLFYQPSGTSNNKDGIEPNIVVPSYSQFAEFHESELDNPLDWVPIKMANYTDYGDTYLSAPLIKSLAAKSKKRVKADKDFKELQKKLDEYNAVADHKSVSLKMDNDKKNESVSSSSSVSKDDNKVYDLENDVFLREAFEISADYAEALNKK